MNHLSFYTNRSVTSHFVPNKEADRKLWHEINNFFSSGRKDYLNHYMSIQQAIQEGANVNKPNENGKLPLHEMAQDEEICELLLKAGADPMLQDSEGDTAFFTYLSVDRWKLFQKYTQASIQEILEVRNKKGNTLFATVCYWTECPEVFRALEYLLNEGVPQDIFNANPHILHKIRSTETGEFLLKRGYPVNILDSDNKYPLDRALEGQWQGDLDFILLLLRYGANPHPSQLWNGYMEYIMYNCNGKYKEFEDHAQIIFQKLNLRLFGWTNLHWAANCGLNKELEDILEDGADEIDRPYGYAMPSMSTPLHLAARNDQTLSVFLLIEKGHANPNVKDKEGDFPKGAFWLRKHEHPIDQLLDIYRHVNREERHSKILIWIEENVRIAIDFIQKSSTGDKYFEPEIRRKKLFIEDVNKIHAILRDKECSTRDSKRQCRDN